MKVTFALALAVLLTAGQAAAQSPADAVKGFSIVLVEGSQQPGMSSDLPAPAKAAIDDIKDFLPFKSFRLLDASWMVGATDVRSRLTGGDRNYDVALAVTRQTQANETDLAIRFTLRDAANGQTVPTSEPGVTAAPTSEPDVNTARQRLEMAQMQLTLQSEYRNLEAMRQRLNPKHPDVLRTEESIARTRNRLALLERQRAYGLTGTAADLRAAAAAGGRAATLIDTSFSMRVGETVVVGTSRVNGERALIALMTAVAKDPVVTRRQF